MKTAMIQTYRISGTSTEYAANLTRRNVVIYSATGATRDEARNKAVTFAIGYRFDQIRFLDMRD